MSTSLAGNLNWRAMAAVALFSVSAALGQQPLNEWVGQQVPGSGQVIAVPAAGSPTGDFRAISMSASHRLAVKLDGTVQAWGDNSQGQTNVPAGLKDVISVAAGATHSVALKSNGTVVTWGDAESAAPQGLADVTAIAAGDHFTIALKSTGTVAIWGAFPNPDSCTDSANADGSIISVAAGYRHVLLLRNNGSVWGCAFSIVGQMPPAAINGRLYPDKSNVIAISASATHNLVLMNNGTVQQFGDGSQELTDLGWTGIQAIAAGDGYSVGLKYDGTVVTAGTGVPAPPSGLTGVTAISAGGHGLLTLQGGMPLAGWKTGTLDPLPMRPELYRSIGGFANYFVALDVNGKGVYSAPIAATYDIRTRFWTPFRGSPLPLHAMVINQRAVMARTADGIWAVDQFSDGQTWTLDYPYFKAFVEGPDYTGSLLTTSVINTVVFATDRPALTQARGYVAASTGYTGFAGLTSDGKVFDYSATGCPTMNGTVSGIKAVASGYAHTLALRADGTVLAWGCDSNGETIVPPGLSGVMAIAAGKNFSVALKSDGTLVTWGVRASKTVPAGLTGVTAVAAGNDQVLVLTKSAGVTLQATPAIGQALQVNGGACNSGYPGNYTFPARFSWIPGMTCTVIAAPVVNDGTPSRSVFTKWDDQNPSNSRSISGSLSGSTYTALYTQQYQLTVQSNLPGAGSVTAGGYFNAGASAMAKAQANPGYRFTGWSGAVVSTDAAVSVPMNSPQTLTANFKLVPQLSVDKSMAHIGETTVLRVQVGPTGATFTGVLEVQVGGVSAFNINVAGSGVYTMSYTAAAPASTLTIGAILHSTSSTVDDASASSTLMVLN